jgi:hypothetical protein
MTIWEIAAEMNVFDNQIGGRFGELERDGLIQKTGQRKPNPRTGCDAEVYAIADVPSSLIPHPSSFGVYPGTLILDGEPYDRQEPIGPHDAPGVPYARAVDNKVRFQVRVELVECPGCGHPLRVIEPRSSSSQTRNIYRCGTPTCNVTWHLALVNELGGEVVTTVDDDPVAGLLRLARDHQVLCVTHLPQIAAYADAHYRIAKRERDGRTVTEVARLSEAERETELAQMIGGTGGGEASRLSARELLDRAGAWCAARVAEPVA